MYFIFCHFVIFVSLFLVSSTIKLLKKINKPEQGSVVKHQSEMENEGSEADQNDSTKASVSS